MSVPKGRRAVLAGMLALMSVGPFAGAGPLLAGAGPLTTAEVAGKVSVEPSLVREWRGTPCPRSGRRTPN